MTIDSNGVCSECSGEGHHLRTCPDACLEWSAPRYPCGDPENGPARRNPINGCIECSTKEAESYDENGLCDSCEFSHEVEAGLFFDIFATPLEEQRNFGDLAKFCRKRIAMAEADGLEISDGDVVDLIADNSNAPLADIRSALVVAGLSHRFPRATRDPQFGEKHLGEK